MRHYCHDVTYSKFGLQPYKLLTDSVWTRRLCCVMEENATVSVSFLPKVKNQLPVYTTNSQVGYVLSLKASLRFVFNDNLGEEVFKVE